MLLMEIVYAKDSFLNRSNVSVCDMIISLMMKDLEDYGPSYVTEDIELARSTKVSDCQFGVWVIIEN